MEKALHIDEANFNKEVIESKLPVFLDIGAEWCPPCRALSPLVDELAGQYAGRMKFGKLDADANHSLVQAYQVASMPTLLIFKGGKVSNAVVGFRAKPDLQKLVEAAL